MWLPVVGLIIGVVLGFLFSVEIPLGYVKYTAIAIMSAIDTILGGLRAQLEDRFDLAIFLSGSGSPLLGVELPGGAGWHRSSSGHQWRFTGALGSFGSAKLLLQDRSVGSLRARPASTHGNNSFT